MELSPDTVLQLAPEIRTRRNAAGHVVVDSPVGTIIDIGPRGFGILSLFERPRRLGEAIDRLEDRFFSTVLLGSGLLYLAMTFVSVALAGGILTAYKVAPTQAIESGLYDFDRTVIYRTSTVFALRMGAVFMICAGTIWLRTRLLRPWAVLVTYGLALVQLLGVGYSLWVTLILPAWVLLVSLVFLITGPRQQPP